MTEENPVTILKELIFEANNHMMEANKKMSQVYNILNKVEEKYKEIDGNDN